MLKIIEKSKIWISISLVVIFIGLGFMFFRGLNFGIDFKGGTKVVLDLGKEVSKSEADAIVKEYAPDAVTNTVNDTQYEIKASKLDTNQVDEMFNKFQEKYKLKDEALISQTQIGPSIGKELTESAIKALVFAVLGILIYTAVRFKFDYGVAAIVALFHDLLITVGVFAIFNIPINTPFIAAILTILGYSINDTIVIFDRIRENSKKMPTKSPTEVADISLNQTMVRSLATTMTTLFVVISLNIFLPTVREFTFPILVGIAVGAYSSIFVASPVWVLLKKYENRKKAA